jgi:hypothetical protein
MAVTAVQARAQQDQGPILKPQKPIAKTGSATLLVECDMACNWELDGEAMGLIAAGGVAKTKVDLGQHLLKATVPFGQVKAKVEKDIDIKTTGQTVVHLELSQAFFAALDNSASKWSKDLVEGLELIEKKRYEDARPYLQNACANEEMEGCTQLGLLYEEGKGVTLNYAEANGLYQKGCQGGEMPACSYLGFQYEDGEGVPQDYSQAYKFFQKACDGGRMASCLSLGRLYEYGHGVTKDYGLARTFYKTACDGGEPNGCGNLGKLYRDGKGVARNDSQARTLFEKACEGGSEDACEDLRKLR